jgi:hypothetical protein
METGGLREGSWKGEVGQDMIYVRKGNVTVKPINMGFLNFKKLWTKKTR